jgi:thiamine biosynthesis lipoprotein
VAVGADLWRVLVAAEGMRELTAGAFDIAVGPLTALWRQARRSGRLPDPDKLAAAKAAVGAGTIELVPETQSVRLPKPGTRLDPGGIGMGYAADGALEVLAARGISSAMIDASGDVLVSAAPPGTDGWRIAVAPLRPGGQGDILVLVHAAVTTSGDAYQAVEIDGVRYSHIVDPRSGLGVAGPTTVTVVAPDATTADALATAASVLGHAAGSDMILTIPDCSARFAWQEAGADRILTTFGWPGRSHEP